MEIAAPHPMLLSRVPDFLVEEFGGEPLTIRKGDVTMHLEWSLPDLRYNWVNEHEDFSKLLLVHVEGEWATVTRMT